MDDWNRPEFRDDAEVKELVKQLQETEELVKRIPEGMQTIGGADPGVARINLREKEKEIRLSLIRRIDSIKSQQAPKKEKWIRSHYLQIGGIFVAIIIAIFKCSSYVAPTSMEIKTAYAIACSHSLVEVGWESVEEAAATITYSYRGSQKECRMSRFSQSATIRDLEGCSPEPIGLNSDRDTLGGQSHAIEIQLVSASGKHARKQVTVKFPQTSGFCAKTKSLYNACRNTAGWNQPCQNFISFYGPQNEEGADLIMETNEDDQGFIEATLFAPFGLALLEKGDFCDLRREPIDTSKLAFINKLKIFEKSSNNPNSTMKIVYRNQIIIVNTADQRKVLVQGGGIYSPGSCGHNGQSGILGFPFSYQPI